MTSTETLTLEQQIDLQISTSGPMSVATYMGLCLTHPSKGYYRAADPIGAKGEFVTAPEISQMFGTAPESWCYKFDKIYRIVLPCSVLIL
jgi:SAM-dependent MidA family methyltransferase